MTLVDGQARLVPVGSVVARTAGALGGESPRLSAEAERAVFERLVAEEVVASMERSVTPEHASDESSPNETEGTDQ